jgi:glycine/D-amino acid oxidase-like deaminating enzyme/nitrite reductase/ring-hydroxylating ferredoxin subunit
MTTTSPVTSLWDDTSLPAYPPLDRSLEVDAVVVGAGITGITAAYLLKQAGCTVALLERNRVGGIDTSCTSAHVTAVTDQDLRSLVSTWGRDHARAVWDAGFAAINQIATLVEQLDISCDFSWVPGFRHSPFDAPGEVAEEARLALVEEAVLAEGLGFDVSMLDRTPLMNTPGWRIEDQALFHPRKYLRALLEAIPGHGSIVCERSEVEFTKESETCHVGPHGVRAGHVVLATHTPLVGRSTQAAAAVLQSRLAYYTSYVAAATVPQGHVLPGCYWDTSSPYRYVRADYASGTLRLIAGGEDHRTGQAEGDTTAMFTALERWIAALAPGSTVTHRWSGQVIESSDGLPLIGFVGNRQFIATGFAGNGMTFGTLAAMMARDAITSGTNPWSELFGPDRSVLAHKPWDYVRQNAAYPYYLVRDRLVGAERRSLSAVRRGEGQLVEVDGEIVAAFRDERGTLTPLSSTCTHMGCRVQWNAADRTWDCPCHGSRFTTAGDVLAGPAESPLTRLNPAGRGREPVAPHR